MKRFPTVEKMIGGKGGALPTPSFQQDGCDVMIKVRNFANLRTDVRNEGKRLALFAAEDIAKGSKVATFTGNIVSQGEILGDFPVKLCGNRYLVRDNAQIDEARGCAWLANTAVRDSSDAKKNNARIRGDGRVIWGKVVLPFIEASQNIKEGEEIMVAYGAAAKQGVERKEERKREEEKEAQPRKRGRPCNPIPKTSKKPRKKGWNKKKRDSNGKFAAKQA